MRLHFLHTNLIATSIFLVKITFYCENCSRVLYVTMDNSKCNRSYLQNDVDDQPSFYYFSWNNVVNIKLNILMNLVTEYAYCEQYSWVNSRLCALLKEGKVFYFFFCFFFMYVDIVSMNRVSFVHLTIPSLWHTIIIIELKW